MSSPRPRPAGLARTLLPVAVALLAGAALAPPSLAARATTPPTSARVSAPAEPYAAQRLTTRSGQVFVPSRVGNPVNDRGLEAGSTLVAGTSRAAVFELGTRRMTVLGAFRGRVTAAHDVNRSGVVAGVVQRTDGSRRAFTWSTRTGAVRLLTAPGATTAHANAINDRGVVVGGIGTAERGYGLVWDTVTGRRTTLDMADAVGVNGRGSVIGHGPALGGTTYRALFWSPATRTVTRLRLLPGDDSALPSDINDAGTAVGQSYSLERDDLVTRPVVWASRRAVPCALSTAQGNGYAGAVDDRGRVVGMEVSFADRTQRSLLWRGCGRASLVLPWPADAYALPTGINHRGQVVGVVDDAGVAWTRG